MRVIRIQAPLARARGLGSAKSGSQHWWLQRVSALALTPLTAWFVLSFTALTNADHREYSQWVSSPLNAVLMILLVITLFFHMALGLQVIAEDYLHIDRIKLFAIIVIQFGCLVLVITGVVSILRMIT